MSTVPIGLTDEERAVLDRGLPKLPSIGRQLETGIVQRIKANDRLELALMPDGSTYVGPHWAVEVQRNEIARDLSFERWLQTGDNIRNGLFGALGYGLGGDEGSDLGAVADAVTFSVGSDHPLNSQYVVSPTDATRLRPAPGGEGTRRGVPEREPPVASRQTQQREPPQVPESGARPPVVEPKSAKPPRSQPEAPPVRRADPPQIVAGPRAPAREPAPPKPARRPQPPPEEPFYIEGPDRPLLNPKFAGPRGTQNAATPRREGPAVGTRAAGSRGTENRLGPAPRVASPDPAKAAKPPVRPTKVVPANPSAAKPTAPEPQTAEAAAAPATSVAQQNDAAPSPRRIQVPRGSQVAPTKSGAAGGAAPKKAAPKGAPVKSKVQGGSGQRSPPPSPRDAEQGVSRAVDRRLRGLDPGVYRTFENQPFREIAEALLEDAEALNAVGRGQLVSNIDTEVLDLSATDLMARLAADGRPQLQNAYRALRRYAEFRARAGEPDLLEKLDQFLADGRIGARRPDTIEMRFDIAQISITDSTVVRLPDSARIHEFKTFFYGEAMIALLGLEGTAAADQVTAYEHNLALGIHREADPTRSLPVPRSRR